MMSKAGRPRSTDTLGEKCYTLRQAGYAWQGVANLIYDMKYQCQIESHNCMMAARGYARTRGLDWPVQIKQWD